jgi:DNA (cytosine-5)-methyltransferase 1
MYKLLDLFCKAGGAGEGYRRAGFEVTGVDIDPQPRYKAGRFVQADALAYVAQYGWMYDAIHASPPCQAHSDALRLAGKNAKQHIDLIPQTRFWLRALGVPYVIENVEGARKSLIDPITLCGASFDLKVYRHRLFESNVFLLPPYHRPHNDKCPPAGRGKSPKGFFSLTSGGITGVSQSERFAAMGIDWMTNAELQQAIPPAFTEFIGKQLVTYLDNVQARNQAPAMEAAA